MRGKLTGRWKVCGTYHIERVGSDRSDRYVSSDWEMTRVSNGRLKAPGMKATKEERFGLREHCNPNWKIHHPAS